MYLVLPFIKRITRTYPKGPVLVNSLDAVVGGSERHQFDSASDLSVVQVPRQGRVRQDGLRVRALGHGARVVHEVGMQLTDLDVFEAQRFSLLKLLVVVQLLLLLLLLLWLLLLLLLMMVTRAELEKANC